MRKPIVAGNWKMYKTPQQAADYCEALLAVPDLVQDAAQIDVLICPPAIDLHVLNEHFKGGPIKVGAQNIHDQHEGAYTGQLAFQMIRELVSYVLLGHSEVRKHLGETDAQINAKVKLVLTAGVRPIIAVGESLEQRNAGAAQSIVNGQVAAALEGVMPDSAANLVIAYEPIWSIGTGVPCNPQDANTMIGSTRAHIGSLLGEDAAAQVRIQYGGSVKPDNMEAYMSQPEIDGALIGGASLKVDDFVTLIRLAIKAKHPL